MRGLDDDYQDLLQLLYIAPVGLIKVRMNGDILLINSVSVQLLMPLVTDGRMSNLFTVLEAVMPDLRAQVTRLNAVGSPIGDDIQIPLNQEASPDTRCKVVSISVTKIDPDHLLASLSDVSENRRVAALMVQSEARLRALFDAAPDAVIRLDTQGRITDWNTRAEKMFGWRKDEVMGLVLHDTIVPPKYRQAYEEGLPQLLATDRTHLVARRIETTAMSQSQEEFPVELSVLALKNEDTYEFTAFISDVTQRKQLQVEIQAKKEYAQNIVESIREPLMVLDSDLKVVTTNQSFYETFQVTPSETIGHFIHDLGNRQWDIDQLHLLLEGILPKSSVFDGYEVTHNFPGIGQKTFSLNAREIYRGDIGSKIILLAMEDITTRKFLEEQVRLLAFYDILTQLPNRRLLNDRLSQLMAASHRSDGHCAVIILDLDNFKSLNDKHGHLVGYLLLIEVARRLSTCIRKMDTVARFGGDEFVVLLGELDPDNAVSLAQGVAEKIRVSLSAAYRLKFTQPDQSELTIEHRCTASIGGVVFVNDQATQHDLLKWADAAMYQAKAAGRNQVRFYESMP